MQDLKQVTGLYGAMLPLAILLMENEEDQRIAAALYIEHKALFFMVAKSFFESYEDIEDVVQDTAGRICEYVEKLKRLERHKTKAYLVKTCRSVCINMYAQRSKESSRRAYDTDEDIENFVDGEMDAHTIVFDRVQARDMLEEFENLREADKDYLLMRYVDDLEYTEIAQAMGITEENARKHVSRARKRLEKLAGERARR